MTRSILHVDMDAFYASVEQLDHPEYRGKPVIVGADPKGGAGRGVVAACSYEARKFGVHSALPISRAWRLCPKGVYVRPRMKRYVEVSAQIMEVFRRRTDLVEPLSIDEAFLDISECVSAEETAASIARAIKKEIREATGLTASVGLAPNKFLAKIASDLKKPDGFMTVNERDVAEFLRDLPISRLWGVGPKAERRLHELGFHTIGQLAAAARESLVQSLGSWGEHLYHLSHGLDERPVITGWEPKSIGSETTFEVDTGDRDLVLQTIHNLADHVAERLRKREYSAGKVTLKLRYSNFATHTKQQSLDRLISTAADIAAVAGGLFAQFPLNRKIRLIGVSAGNLRRPGGEPEQLRLF